MKCRRGPLSDDFFQLIQEEERVCLRVLAAGVDVRALVAGQSLQQILAQGAAGGDRVLEGERGVVVGGRDLHDEEAGFGHVLCVDRSHDRHDAPAGAAVSGPRWFHPAVCGM